MNKVCLTGRIVKDLELRYSSADKAVVNFSLAVQRKYKNPNGDYETDFINCVVYGKPAETLEKYAQKGDLIGIEGRIQTRTYENKDNKKVYVTEIIVDNYDFLSTKGKSSKEEETTQNEPEIESSKGLSDDVFEEFGQQIEITDEDIAF